MSTNKRGTRYDEEFKRTLVNLYQNGNKSQAALCEEYGVSINALGRWIKQYSSVETDDGDCTNHLHQEFNQKAPNVVWASDFTYIKVAGKWYYLCIVMDLFSCKVISWHISAKPDVDLIITTFKKAYQKRNCPSGLMFHSDQRSQYS